MKTTVYAETLAELLKYELMLEYSTASDNDFIDFQRLEQELETRYINGYYNYRRLQALRVVAQGIHADFRLMLSLDR